MPQSNLVLQFDELFLDREIDSGFVALSFALDIVLKFFARNQYYRINIAISDVESEVCGR